MKATFLGHGLDTGNKPNVGEQLAVSLESEDYSIFNGFVAFATLSGVKSLKSHLQIAESNYEHIRFYIGIDNKVTSEEALKFLLSHIIETYIYHDELNNRSIYHPKLFLFEGFDFSRIIIGSSNLTYQALNTNLEASIQLDFSSKNDSEGLNTLTEIKEYYSSLLDLSSPNIKLLTKEHLEDLIKKNLLSNNDDEPKANDDEEEVINSRNDYEKKFTENDNDKFDTLIGRYIIYKETERPDGIVSKHTKDEELLKWYQKMHALYGQGTNSFPFEIFERLLDVDFPFDGIGLKRKQLIKWNIDFQKLLEYKKKVDPNKNYTYVPQYKSKSNRYYNIGQWCAIQKQRRKGNKNYGIKWSQYEEDKMNSINFIWDISTIENRLEDDKWTDNLVEIEVYFSKKGNYKTLPTQQIYIGHWLSDQMSFKTKQDREGRNDLISLERETMLGDLLSENDVDWEWRKQKEREGIQSKIESWQFVEKLKSEGKAKEFREKNPKLLKKYRDDVAQLRSHTKRWNNEKNKWKFALVDKVGFPYEKE